MTIDIESWIPVILPLLSMIVVAFGLIAQHFTTIAGIKERITCLEVKIEPFWKLVETQLPTLLKHPVYPRRDELLDKMIVGNLTYDEAIELEYDLQTEFKLNSIPDLKLVYVFVIGRLGQIIYTLKPLK